MDVLAISPKNTTQKVVPIEGCAKFAVDDTPTVLHGLKIQKYKKKETMKTLIPKKTNQKK